MSSRSEIPISAEIPIEEKVATIEGRRIRYLRAGSGPPLLLIHGLMGYSFSWRFNIPVFAQKRTVYAIDLLGAGYSDRPGNLDCSLHATARRLLQLLDELQISVFDLLGTSHGGAVAMVLAAGAGKRVRSLILSDPVNPWSSHGRLITKILGSAAGSALTLRLGPHMARTHNFFLRRLYGNTHRIAPGTLEGYSAAIAVPGTFEYLAHIMRCWHADLDHLHEIFPAIRHIPTLLIWGGLDAAVFPESARELRKKFDHCELVIFEGVGHLPYEEVPDEFNRVVLHFLDSAARS
jgi:pimeloyl-ACP methyl ester carboxylesterase